jgi:hypothetical protein
MEWESNGLSNAFAWASYHVVPTWCQARKDRDHWTVRFVNSLYTSCSCCMFFRGILIGFAASVPLWLLVGTAAWYYIR